MNIVCYVPSGAKRMQLTFEYCIAIYQNIGSQTADFALVSSNHSTSDIVRAAGYVDDEIEYDT